MSTATRAFCLTLAALSLTLLGAACDGDDPAGDDPSADVVQDPGDDPTPDATDLVPGDAIEDPVAETGPDVGAETGADTSEEPDSVDLSDLAAPCTDDERPIVFAHGFLGSGDNFANQIMRFNVNGYCHGSLWAFDWNTLNRAINHNAALDRFIDAVLAETGAEQVDLMGHSAGGGLGYEYLADPVRAAKVAHYVHIASFVTEGPAGPEGAPVPTLNLWSDGDLVIGEAGDIEGATNVMLDGVDHFAVATSAEAFEAMYAFLHDGAAPPEGSAIVPSVERPLLGGRALTFGENVPEAGASVEVYRVDPETGARASERPVARLTSDEAGYWGPFRGDATAYYEFRIESADGGIPVHYYREPQVRTNPVIYLRTLPQRGSLVGILLASVPFEDEHAVLVTFTSNVALLAGRDSLTVNGFEVATEELAAADKTSIAFFYYDANENQESEHTSIPALATLGQFVAGIDAYFPAGEGETITATYNGRTLRAPAWPSGSEGAVVMMFE